VFNINIEIDDDICDENTLYMYTFNGYTFGK